MGPDMKTCGPEPDKVAINCEPSDMNITIDQCVLQVLSCFILSSLTPRGAHTPTGDFFRIFDLEQFNKLDNVELEIVLNLLLSSRVKM